MAHIFRILEDVEKQAFGFVATGSPDRSVSRFPVVDKVGLDVEIDEEGYLWLAGTHGEG
jgi:hypothetical protein